MHDASPFPLSEKFLSCITIKLLVCIFEAVFITIQLNILKNDGDHKIVDILNL